MNWSRIISDILIFMALLVAAVAMESCKHEPINPQTNNGGNGTDTTSTDTTVTNNCDPNIIYFQNEILPIFISNCAMANCHNVASAQDGIVLDSYTSVMNSNILEPGDAEDSDLYEVLTEDDEDKRMPRPPANPLSAEQIGMIKKWIDQGAKNVVCTTNVCDTSTVTFAGSIAPILKNKCLGCHSGNAPSGGLNFSTHSGVQAVALNRKLSGAVNHQSGFVPMPQGGSKLPACDLDKIRIWIQNGAPNN